MAMVADPKARRHAELEAAERADLTLLTRLRPRQRRDRGDSEGRVVGADQSGFRPN
jgi:hypothetical protein